MAFWDKLLKRNSENKDISAYLEEKEIQEALQNDAHHRNVQNKDAHNEKNNLDIKEQKLFIPNIEKPYYSENQIAYMEKLVEGLPLLEKDNINFRKWNLSQYENGWMLQLLFRNGSYEETLSFEMLPITVLDTQQEIICQQEFDFTNEEPIPPRSVRFCTFIFEEEQVQKKDADISNWSIKLG